MGRKKAAEPAQLFSRHVQTKVTEIVYQRLVALQKDSDCESISEVARRILSKEKIITYQKDQSMDLLMEKLVGIRRELNAIGHNINQVTRQFHAARLPNDKLFAVLKISDAYAHIDVPVQEVLKLISILGKKWLQK